MIALPVSAERLRSGGGVLDRSSGPRAVVMIVGLYRIDARSKKCQIAKLPEREIQESKIPESRS
jgi:hypothetical protein